jgi:hypothetical protein
MKHLKKWHILSVIIIVIAMDTYKSLKKNQFNLHINAMNSSLCMITN